MKLQFRRVSGSQPQAATRDPKWKNNRRDSHHIQYNQGLKEEGQILQAFRCQNIRRVAT